MMSNIVTITFHNEEKKELFRQWCNTASEMHTWEDMPPLVKDFDSNDRFLFDVYSQSADYIQFESKWAAPISTLVKMAKAYEFSFIDEVEEGGCLIYGACSYDWENDSYEEKVVDADDWPEDDEDNLYIELDKLLEKAEWVTKDYNNV